MIKVLLAFLHQEFPPVANSNQLNPQIPFDQTNIRPVQQPESWPRNQTRPRIAGTSAFGVGGTNCHVIVQEPPVFTATASPRDVHLLCLSAPSADDLQRVAETYSDTFSAQPDAPLSQLCAGVNQRATRFAHRRFVLARDHAGAIAQLRQHRMQPSVSAKQARTTFLFPGAKRTVSRCRQPPAG